MDYINLGKTGLKVSRLCLGTMSYGSTEWRKWVLEEAEGRPFIQRAIELGITFFDTADMYSIGGSEEFLGKAIKDYAIRNQVIIATKVFHRVGPGPNDQGLSRKHIMDSIDASLRRLRTDYVDLYQIHRWDYTTPIEETMEALDDVVRSGKVRYIGASSMFAYQLATAQHTAERHGWSKFVVMQNHYNLVYREEEREMIPYCRQEGMGIIPWSPLARGFLAGNRQKDKTGDTQRALTDEYAHQLYYRDTDFQIVDRVALLARKKGCKPIQIALAWLLHQPGITAPIIGATRLEHLDDAVAALTISLETEDCKFLEEPYMPHPVLGHS